MRPSLDSTGKLISPASRVEAFERVRQLQHECDKIEVQLVVRRLESGALDGTADAYLDWCSRARKKLGEFRSEAEQLSVWLAGYDAAVAESGVLFKDAYKALQVVELLIDFPEAECEVMERLDRHFEEKTAKVG